MKTIWDKIKEEKQLWLLLVFFAIVYSFGIFHKFGRLSVYGDEVHVIFSVLKFFRDFNFVDPYAYAFPIMTILYIPFLAAFFVMLFISGQVHSITELQNMVILETYKFVPVFRFTTVVFFLFIFKQKKWALMGVYLLGTSFIFTKISFVAIKWIPQAMTMIIALYYFLLLSKKKHWSIKEYVYSGILIGVNYGIALVGAGVIVPFFLVWYRSWKNNLAGNWKKGLLIFFAVIIILIVLLTISSPTLAQSTFSYLSKAAATGAGERLNEETLSFRLFGYAKYLWSGESLLVLISLAGLILAYKKNRNIFYILLYYFLTFYVVLGPILGSIRQRRLVIIIPVLVIFALFFISWLSKHRIGKRFSYFILAIFLINPFLIVHELLKTDSKMVAKQWVEQNIPPDAVVFDTCDLDLPDNFDKINYIKQNNPELLTSEHNYILAHPDLAQGKRFATFIDNNNLNAEKFNEVFGDKEHYLVFCYENSDPETHVRWKIEEEYFNNLYNNYRLEKLFDFRDQVKYFGNKPHYLIHEASPLYFIKSFKQVYNDYNFNIYRIDR